jgi:hypothetical protein
MENPYETPVDVNEVAWQIAPWLKRFLIAVAVIIGTVFIYDALYMRRLQRERGGLYEGQGISEIFETWANDEMEKLGRK